MKVDVTDIEMLMKRIEFDIPQDIVEKEVGKIYHKLNTSKQVKGFRRGKVPNSILKRLFWTEIENEVVNTIVPDFYYTAIQETGFDVIGKPMFEDVKIEDGKALHVSAKVTLKPSIKAKNYKGINVELIEKDVTEEDVNKLLRSLQEKNAQYEIVEKGPVKEGDIVIVDLEGRYKEDASLTDVTYKDILIQIPGGDKPDDILNPLLDKNKGDVVKIKGEFPDNFQVMELREKDADLDVTIKEVKEKILPELDDEFAKDLGEYETLEELKNKLRETLKESLENQINSSIKEQAVSALIKENPFDPPDVMVNERLDEMLDDVENRIRLGGGSPENINWNREKVRERFRPEAIKYVQMSLILESVAREEAMEVSEEELDKELMLLANQAKKDFQELKETAQKNGTLNFIKNNLLTNKAMDFVVENTIKVNLKK